MISYLTRIVQPGDKKPTTHFKVLSSHPVQFSSHVKTASHLRHLTCKIYKKNF